MRLNSSPLEVQQSVATGADRKCEDLIDKHVQVEGFGSATVAVQGSYDGSVWFTVATVSADTDVDVIEPFKYIRTDTTAWASGTITALLIGRDARTD